MKCSSCKINEHEPHQSNSASSAPHPLLRAPFEMKLLVGRSSLVWRKLLPVLLINFSVKSLSYGTSYKSNGVTIAGCSCELQLSRYIKGIAATEYFISFNLTLKSLAGSVLSLTLTSHKSSQLAAFQQNHHIYKENGANNDFRKKHLTFAALSSNTVAS